MMTWADRAWDPFTGCSPISEGCKNCIARWQFIGKGFWRRDEFRPTIHRERFLAPIEEATKQTIFVCPQGDLFHEAFSFEVVHELLDVMREAQQHIYYLLTKREERMRQCLSSYKHWPLPHVNVGVTAENQRRLEQRAPVLISTPVHSTALRFLSCEPLLGPLALGPFGNDVNWVILGAERPAGLNRTKSEWLLALKQECRTRGLPVYHHRSGSREDMQTPQQRRQQEDAMKIELLNQVPNDSTPSVVLDRSLLENVQGLRINGVAIVFTKPGEMGDQPVAVPINMVSESTFEKQDCVQEAKPRKLTIKPSDLPDIGLRELMDHGVSKSTYYGLLRGKTIIRATHKRMEKALSEIKGRPVNFEAPIFKRS